MSFFVKFKYFSTGCLGGVITQLYLASLAEQKLQFRRSELRRLKSIINDGKDNLYQINGLNILEKESSNLSDLSDLSNLIRKEEDVIFPLLYHTYLNYMVSSVMVFAKFLSDEVKREKIEKYIRTIFKSSGSEDKKEEKKISS